MSFQVYASKALANLTATHRTNSADADGDGEAANKASGTLFNAMFSAMKTQKANSPAVASAYGCEVLMNLMPPDRPELGV